MKRIARELKGTEFSIKEVGKTLTCTSPWGHVLRVHQAGQLSGRMPQAISYVNFWVPVGTAKTIADFYEKMVYAPTKVAKRGKHAMAVVTVGANQHFHFIEARLRARRPPEPRGDLRHPLSGDVSAV